MCTRAEISRSLAEVRTRRTKRRRNPIRSVRPGCFQQILSVRHWGWGSEPSEAHGRGCQRDDSRPPVHGAILRGTALGHANGRFPQGQVAFGHYIFSGYICASGYESRNSFFDSTRLFVIGASWVEANAHPLFSKINSIWSHLDTRISACPNRSCQFTAFA